MSYGRTKNGVASEMFQACTVKHKFRVDRAPHLQAHARWKGRDRPGRFKSETPKSPKGDRRHSSPLFAGQIQGGLFLSPCACRPAQPPAKATAASGGVGYPSARDRPVASRRPRATRRHGAGSESEDADSDPARAVVTPPHLPAKTNAFYALMRRALAAVWRGPRGDRRADFSMRFYAPWLCSLCVSSPVPRYAQEL